MARVTGPLMSMSASGTIGKALTFATWKGVAYVREWFVPSNPKTEKQTNVRGALTISVAKWQTLDPAIAAAYNTGAEGTGQSGANLMMKRCLNAYNDQFGSGVVPVAVTVVGNYPLDVITWNPV